MSRPVSSKFSNNFLTRLEAECLPRIEKFTVPFYYLQNNEAKRDRTGVLYKVAGKHFILTASHDLRTIVEKDIPLFIDYADINSSPIPLTTSMFHCNEKRSRDVAAIILPDEVVRELIETKEFLTHRDVKLSDEAADALYVMFGFPGAWPCPLVYLSGPYNGQADRDFFNPLIHIELDFSQSAVSVLGKKTKQLPRLHGVSGCGIWKVTECSQESFDHWRPEQVSLVAIQHRWYEIRKCIRGTWVGSVLALIQDNYPDVSAAMNIIYPP